MDQNVQLVLDMKYRIVSCLSYIYIYIYIYICIHIVNQFCDVHTLNLISKACLSWNYSSQGYVLV